MAISDKLIEDKPLVQKIPLCKKEYGITSLIIGLSLFSIGYFMFNPNPITTIQQYMIGIGIGAVMVFLYLGAWVAAICFADHFKGKIHGKEALGFKTGATITFFVILSIMLLVYYYPWGFVVEPQKDKPIVQTSGNITSTSTTFSDTVKPKSTITPTYSQMIEELKAYASHLDKSAEVTIDGKAYPDSSSDPNIYSNIMIDDMVNDSDNRILKDMSFLNTENPDLVQTLNTMDCNSLIDWRFANYAHEDRVYASYLIKKDGCYDILYEKMVMSK